MVQYPQGVGDASPVASMGFLQGSRGTDSRVDESSPIGSASPVSQEQQPIGVDPVNTPVWSDNDSSPEETEKKEGRVFWSEQENLRLVSAWLKHSTDPIVGVDRRGDRYWKAVAAEYNLNIPKDRRRTGTQPIEEMMNKRSKLNASGAYTSSNQDSEDADPAIRCRPPGQNGAKAKQKGKGKSVHSEDSISNENVTLFNELQLRKTIAAEKIAEATLIKAEAVKAKAEAENKMADNEMEKAKLQTMGMYMSLLDKDISSDDEEAKERHKQLLAYLAAKLFS